MMKNIAVVTGGDSGEDVISFQSAEVVLSHINPEKYHVYKIIIAGDKWALEQDGKETPIDKNDFSCRINNEKLIFDCVFLVIHGTPGEDGKLQGYFDLLHIPYTCSGVAASAITFNKAMTISLLSQHGIDTAHSIVLLKNEKVDIDGILSEIAIPCFVKPNNGGSSIGISKVNKKEELPAAIEKAYKEDHEVMVEDFLAGTEITCAVICHDGNIKALAVTEIVSKNEFFDFDAKYLDSKTEEITPARISKEAEENCMHTSERIYKILNCKGMVRIDYMLNGDKLSLIEVNTIPGLTERSLVPQQAEYAGMSLQELFTKEVEEALRPD